MHCFISIIILSYLVPSATCQNRNVIIQGTQVVVDGSTVTNPAQATSIAQSFSSEMSSAMVSLIYTCFPFCHDDDTNYSDRFTNISSIPSSESIPASSSGAQRDIRSNSSTNTISTATTAASIIAHPSSITPSSTISSPGKSFSGSAHSHTFHTDKINNNIFKNIRNFTVGLAELAIFFVTY